MKGAADQQQLMKADESDLTHILYNKNLPHSIMVQVWSSWL